MEMPLLKKVFDDIDQIRLLSHKDTSKNELIQGYCQKLAELVEYLKPALSEIVSSEVSPEGQGLQVLEVLDASVNEAKELVAILHPMTSKLYFVLQMEITIKKIGALALELCKAASSLLPSPKSSLPARCIEKFEELHHEQISSVIQEVIRDQRERNIHRPEQLDKISNFFSLCSNQELLMEAIALEKLKVKASRGEINIEVENIDNMIKLITYMHDSFVKVHQLHNINGKPIPADFCCPLSLQLMSDPVIVASGQTYERAFIKKWIDQGFNICPKTRQTLGHTNLIPNYTVKALIANWCESNRIKLPDPIKSMNLSLPPFLSQTDASSNDYAAIESIHSHKDNVMRSPESNQSMMGAEGNMHSSNGVHQETHTSERPVSHNHNHSGGSSVVTNGREKNMTSDDHMSISNRNEDSSSQTYNEQKTESQSPGDIEQLQGHKRDGSAFGAISSNEHTQRPADANIVSRASGDLAHLGSDGSEEVAQDVPASSVPQKEPESAGRLGEARPRIQNIWRRPSVPRVITSQPSESRPDLSGLESQVRKLVEDLKSDSDEVQRAATEELRLLAKHNMENRIVIANCGAISLLVGLLHSTDAKTQENAVTALLNLSINDNNKTAIANADAIDPLIHVLETGNSEAKENSAATLFSLSVVEENKASIGRSGAIKPLVKLLGNGTPRGKKDAATALFNLSIFHENKARIVQAGAVKHLVELMDPAAGMVDKAVAVLGNLATIPEGRTAIGNAGGIPLLVEVVELGSSRGKENAAAALLQLVTHSSRFCSIVLQEGAVPPLVALSQSGTPRAKEKAQALLSYFRNQRHGNAGRG